LLILSQMLADNPQGNLTEKQVEYAQTINVSGRDLLELITDILDLSKIESGTMSVTLIDISIAELEAFVERTFTQIAITKGIALNIIEDPGTPPSIRSDGKRLQQVIKNLMSNALKFTEKGSVTLRIGRVTEGWSHDHPVLRDAPSVIA